MIHALFTLLLILWTGKSMDLAHTSYATIDYDSAWDEMFGHLSKDQIGASMEPVLPKGEQKHSLNLTNSAKHIMEMEETVSTEKLLQGKILGNSLQPPFPPFVYDPLDKGKIPSIGAHSQGSMEGIAISQNSGVSLGIYMGNSSYNSFNYVFGNSSPPPVPPNGSSRINSETG